MNFIQFLIVLVCWAAAMWSADYLWGAPGFVLAGSISMIVAILLQLIEGIIERRK